MRWSLERSPAEVGPDVAAVPGEGREGDVGLERGVHPGIASAVLGHASPAFTMATYHHVVDGMAERAAEAIEEALWGGA